MFPNDPQKAAKIANALYIVLISAAFVLIARGITEVKTTANMGQAPSQNVISVSGTGDAYATPDIANISYDISQEEKTVVAAQDSVTKRSNDILAYLKSIGVADKDIKTTNYNIYPHYEYNSRPVICYSGADCPPTTNGQVFIGYVVTNSVQVKIRKIADAGSVLAELGARKVTNLSNLNFTIENDEAIKAEARKKAIEDAKQKAEVLAKDLGVSLVRIVSFSEGGNYPIYAKTMSADSAYGMGGGAPAVPSVPTGENKITSSVTIVYEIR